MTHNKLADIAEQIKTNEALKTDIKAATGGTDEISVDDFLRIANNHGYSITHDDLAVGLAASAGEPGELNDEQLGQIAGGPNRREHDPPVSFPDNNFKLAEPEADSPITTLKLKL